MSADLRKLHLGCFDQVVPGWINTDITLHIFVSRIPGLAWLLFKARLLPEYRFQQHSQGLFRKVRYLDVTKRFPYSNSVFDCVYSSHMLEHLYPQQAAFCLSEIHRVLRQGGVVRVAVPDLDRLVASYTPEQADAFLESIFETTQKREKNKHHWHYNEFTLTRLLRLAGFTDVYRCRFRQGRCVDVNSIDNRPESLFIEAIK